MMKRLAGKQGNSDWKFTAGASAGQQNSIEVASHLGAGRARARTAVGMVGKGCGQAVCSGAQIPLQGLLRVYSLWHSSSHGPE